MRMPSKSLHAGVLLPVLALLALAGAALPAAASALNPERHYEMVSPPYKGGLGAPQIEAVAENGESVAYYSPGVFAGSPAGLSQGLDPLDYVARRGSSGWSTTPLEPPDAFMPTVVGAGDISPSLDTTLVEGVPAPNFEAGAQAGTEVEFLSHATETSDVGGDFTLLGEPLKPLVEEPLTSLHYFGASKDFCNIVFRNEAEELQRGGYLLPEAKGALRPLYELVSGCSGEPAELRLVALDNNGNIISPLCEPNLGIAEYHIEVGSEFNAISTDGREAFFTTCIKNQISDYQLFVRLGGSKTIEVSRPLSEICGEGEVPCKGAAKRASADFAGASEDGSRVFFTTTAPLAGEDKDSGNDLYMATIGCSPSTPGCAVAEREVTSLTQVSHDPVPGEAAEVQGVVKIAPDGARAYFVARGVLTSEPGPEGRVPQSGADNLYVYSTTSGGSGGISFIGDLCSGHEFSGSVGDISCPNKTGSDEQLWRQRREVQTAGSDGGFLVFSSYAQLTPDDTDEAKDVYRYDAVTGALVRISGGEGGYDSDGNNSAFDATIATVEQGGLKGQYNLATRAISEDGSRIVFTSAEVLSPSAKNHLANVYEWHEAAGGQGAVSLVSAGTGESPVEDVVISPDGDNIFFDTTQGLLPQDTDGAPDVYDARIGGGDFPSAPAQPRACDGDACQGPLTNPAPLLVPGSVSQAPGENLPAPVVTQAKSKPKAKKKAKSQKKKKKKTTKKKARNSDHGKDK
jgi:hypothetical protein